MKSWNKRIIMLSLVFGAMLNACLPEGNCDDTGINSEKLKDFRLIKEMDHKDSKIYVFENDKEGGFLQIEKIEQINRKSADILIKDKIASVQAIYANEFSAYPGEVSNKIVCSDAFKPVYSERTINDTSYRYYFLYSTERFGLGACSEDIVKYRHLLGWIYCPQSQKLYGVKYFMPLNNHFEKLEQLFLSFSCSAS